MDLDRRLLLRALVVALVVEHVLLVIKPLDVLAPLDPWRIGQQLLHGSLPYRDFSFEYPPLAAVAFLVPGLVPHGAAKSMLAIQAIAAEAIVAWFVLRRRGDALVRYGVLSLLVFPFLSGGFDAFTMAAIALSTAWLADDQVRGWVAAGVGALIKISPAVAWVWCRRRLGPSVVVLLATLALALGPLAVAASATSSYVGYALKRGVQVESVAASTTWVAHHVAGRPDHYAYRFKSWQIGGGGPAAVAWSVAAVAAALTIFAVSWRRRMDPWVASLTSVVLFLCGSKVLSPQFIAWAAPVAAMAGGRWYRAYAVAAGLTFVAYGVASGPGPILAFSLVRNGVLVGIAAAGVLTLVRGGAMTATE